MCNHTSTLNEFTQDPNWINRDGKWFCRVCGIEDSTLSDPDNHPATHQKRIS